MSRYTTELRFICESLHKNESGGYHDIESVVSAAAPKIFSFPFPYWKDSDRTRFEKMILKAFYTREICEETYGLWKLRLENKLNQIMPYYNKLYESTELEFDPLTDYNEERNYTRDTDTSNNTSQHVDGTTSSESTIQNLGKNLDTPQNGVQDLLKGNYLTSANTTDGSSSGSGTNVQNQNGSATGTLDETYQETVKGKRGASSYGKLLTEYRQAIINVDQLVLGELEELFIGVW